LVRVTAEVKRRKTCVGDIERFAGVDIGLSRGS